MDQDRDVAIEVRLEHSVKSTVESLRAQLETLPHVEDYMLAIRVKSPTHVLLVARSRSWQQVYTSNQRQLTEKVWPQVRNDLQLVMNEESTGKQLHQRLQLNQASKYLQQYTNFQCKKESIFQQIIDEHEMDMDAISQRKRESTQERYQIWRVSNCSIVNASESISKLNKEQASLAKPYFFTAAFLPVEPSDGDVCDDCGWKGFHYHYIVRAKGVCIDTPSQMLESDTAQFQLVRDDDMDSSENAAKFYGCMNLKNYNDQDMLDRFIHDVFYGRLPDNCPVNDVVIVGKNRDMLDEKRVERKASLHKAKKARVGTAAVTETLRTTETTAKPYTFYEFAEDDTHMKGLEMLQVLLLRYMHRFSTPTTLGELQSMMKDIKQCNITNSSGVPPSEWEGTTIKSQIVQAWKRWTKVQKEKHV